MPIWGAGPSLGLPTALYGLAALAATLIRPSIFTIEVAPHPILAILGGTLLAIGIPLYVVSLRTMLKAHREERLATGGVYAFCRHPIYASWILLILPAVGLLLNSWLFLSTAVVMYVMTRVHIGREEENLVAQFGQEYIEYKRRVGAIFPTLRRGRPGRA